MIFLSHFPNYVQKSIKFQDNHRFGFSRPPDFTCAIYFPKTLFLGHFPSYVPKCHIFKQSWWRDVCSAGYPCPMHCSSPYLASKTRNSSDENQTFTSQKLQSFWSEPETSKFLALKWWVPQETHHEIGLVGWVAQPFSTPKTHHNFKVVARAKIMMGSLGIPSWNKLFGGTPSWI